MRNLSLHLADRGGSSTIGCSITVESVNEGEDGHAVLCKLTCHFDAATRPYPSRVWPHAIELAKQGQQGRSGGRRMVPWVRWS